MCNSDRNETEEEDDDDNEKLPNNDCAMSFSRFLFEEKKRTR